MTSSVERALLTAFPWLVAGVVVSPAGLLLGAPGPQPLSLVTVHLSLLVVFGLVVADRLIPLLEVPWFADRKWSELRTRLAGAAVLVVVPTGVTALVSLASSAALRFEPSLQFLQLLSALDIVWAGAALMYGAYLLEGRLMSRGSGVLLGGACVMSLWLYLDTVGFTSSGGWLVDGEQLMRLVIPVDMAAAVAAIAVLAGGIRRSVRASG